MVLAIVVAAALFSADGLAGDGLAGDGAAQEKKAAGVAGKWILNVDSPHGATDMGLLLKQEGKKVTGTFASPHGDLPVEGEFVDATLTLSTTSAQADTPQVSFTAKLKEDGTLAGYLSAPMGDMKWTAKRVKDSEVPATSRRQAPAARTRRRSEAPRPDHCGAAECARAGGGAPASSDK